MTVVPVRASSSPGVAGDEAVCAMPSLDAIDWAPLLEMWYADGHHNANSLARGDDPSIVLKRLAKEAKLRDHTPIGTKRVR